MTSPFPENTARADIDVGAQPATVVPTAAVLYRNNKAGVFLLQTDSTVRFQPIEVIARNETQTSVSGVQPGVRVVVDGAGFLNQGDRVRVATPAATAPARAPAAAAK